MYGSRAFLLEIGKCPPNSHLNPAIDVGSKLVYKQLTLAAYFGEVSVYTSFKL